MRLLRNVLIGFVSVSLTLALIFALLGYQWSREAWPQVAGNMRVAGLAENVEVLRDIYGVPHIYADTPEDLFRAQGLVHAQERFFQMEFWRRVGQGRLSELFGRSTLDQDRFIRTVGFHRAAELDLPAMTGATKLALEAYAAGVNAYMLPRADEPALLALEFRVLGLLGRTIKLDPWLPIHTLTWQKVMAWDLKGDSLDNELLNSAILKQGGADLLRALRPNYPADMPVIVPSSRLVPTPPAPEDDGHASPDIADAALDLLAQIKSFDDLIGHEPSNGSNNWVVHGTRSSTGRPLLANDPHLGIQMPSIWFQIGLHCRVVNDACPYDVAGVSFAGVPGVVIGHNQRIAWCDQRRPRCAGFIHRATGPQQSGCLRIPGQI